MGTANEKVILAYSGGLDTTAIIPWLKENYGFDVICVCIDCGQEEELDHLEERAKYCGAEKLYIIDVTEEFADEYIVPACRLMRYMKTNTSWALPWPVP
jgi:argininosuccinate synthase